MKQLVTEVFVVILKKKNGPNLAKASGERFFCIEEEAEEHLNKMPKEIGKSFEVRPIYVMFNNPQPTEKEEIEEILLRTKERIEELI